MVDRRRRTPRPVSVDEAGLVFRAATSPPTLWVSLLSRNSFRLRAKICGCRSEASVRFHQTASRGHTLGIPAACRRNRRFRSPIRNTRIRFWHIIFPKMAPPVTALNQERNVLDNLCSRPWRLVGANRAQDIVALKWWPRRQCAFLSPHRSGPHSFVRSPHRLPEPPWTRAAQQSGD